MVLKSLSDELYGSSSSLTFASYMGVIVPSILINILFLWVLLQFFSIGLNW